MSNRFRCITCKQVFNTPVPTTQCSSSGGGHFLQEMVDGSKIITNDGLPTGESADFLSVDESDLKRWGEQAKKLFSEEE